MYTVVAYGASNNSATLLDTPYISDAPMFSPRNNHAYLTEDYDLVGATAIGNTLAAAQIDSPTFDAWNPVQIYPAIVAAAAAPTVPANPNVMDLRAMPIKLPTEEEIQVKLANGGGGAERDYALLWLRASGPGANDYPIPPATRNNPRFPAICTINVAITQLAWSAFATIAFTNPLRGGVYQMNALYVICATGLAYQVNFPRQPMYQGRKLFPGNLCDTTYGNQIMRFGGTWLGGLGQFTNLELPQVRILAGTTAGATTYTCIADLSYLRDPSGISSIMGV